ncbi:hypothetical protein [Terriglobus saanensis]|uniref:Lipoprotein n=1 Tax=Terriglobus saanensis (strain ATCC BAA-1853 / DSM 23119 / SP1PR4) TaxID=401053 RepID=E8V0P9_TERSS|nr:hypothetical protein [Terriglobus saanensis]ADV81112.1 hypothetical protein AciPR4_0274 [Terriglobus saanensis SP1PR4]
MPTQNRLSAVPLRHRISTAAGMLVLSMLVLSGCQSKQDKAVDAAKQQAIATGQPQQVVSVDRSGNTITSIVRPPAPGQKEASVVTTTTPAGANPSTLPGGTDFNAGAAPAPAPTTAANAPAAGAPVQGQPVAGGAAVIRPLDVHIAEGTTLAIRVNQHISVKTAMAGDPFDGTLAEGITGDDGRLIVPRGTPVAGVVSAAHKRGHFKGSSILSLRLTSMTFDGHRYPLSTGHLTRTKKGKGKRSAAWIGGGAGVGMLIGGIATGGVGLLVGGLAGGGAGTLIAGTTGNRDIDIPAESIVRFRLTEGLSVVPE